jgi:hypothetical protein
MSGRHDSISAAIADLTDYFGEAPFCLEILVLGSRFPGHPLHLTLRRVRLNEGLNQDAAMADEGTVDAPTFGKGVADRFFEFNLVLVVAKFVVGSFHNCHKETNGDNALAVFDGEGISRCFQNSVAESTPVCSCQT